MGLRNMRALTGLSGAIILASITHAGGTLEVPGDAPTIQGAIDLASSGDTILIDPATYNETLDLGGKSLTIRGVSGPNLTFIDGGNAGSVITTGAGGTVTIDGLNITGGNANQGGAINAGDSAALTVQDSVITGNAALRGAGIFSTDGTLTVVRTRLFDNSAEQFGGGIFSSGMTTVASCLMVRNHAELAGGHVYANADVRIDGATLVDGTALQGGGVFIGGSGDITNAILHGNRDNTGNSEGAHVMGLDVFTIRYSFIEALPDSRGGSDGLITGDPGFNDPGADNYTLSPGSICIDAGDSTASLLLTTSTDLNGNERVFDDEGTADSGIADGMGNVVDMGALEVQPVCADASGDGMVNFADLNVILDQWNTPGPEGDLDSNGFVDFGDLNALLDQWGTSCGGMS